MHLRLAACQILTYPKVEKSAAKIIHWLKNAASSGADVAVFPEASLCGYAADPAYWQNADPAIFQRYEAEIIEAAELLDIAVVLGSAHWEDGRLYNSLLIIDKGGQVRGRYAKTHLAEQWPVPGRSLPLFEVAGVKSCFIICHDIRYPELVRLPAIAGAQLCYYCSNESGLLAEHKLSAYRAMPIARATENGLFLVMANAPSDPDNMHSPSQSHGNSMVVHPDGNVLVEAGHFEERLLLASIDIDQAHLSVAKRAVQDNTCLQTWMQQGATLVEDCC